MISAANTSGELLTFTDIICAHLFCALHLNSTAHVDLMVHMVLIF